MSNETKKWAPVKLQRLDLYSLARTPAVEGFADMAYLSLGVSKREADRCAAYLNHLEAAAALAGEQAKRYRDFGPRDSFEAMWLASYDAATQAAP